MILDYFEVTFLGKREDAALGPPIYCILIIYGFAASEQYVIEFPCFPYIWWYFKDRQLSCF